MSISASRTLRRRLGNFDGCRPSLTADGLESFRRPNSATHAHRKAAVIGSENCLFLNVYAPHARKKRGPLLPVMVWIHGGGLTAGSADIFDPSPLVEHGNLIVVTINYRIGLLGFFAHPAIDAEGHPRGNYGLMDQQFALEWVRQNIPGFGGNNRLVTIFGQSAGGLSAYCNLASPTAAGLFQGAIAESGSYAGFTDYLGEIVPVAVAETVGTPFVPSGIALATTVGCPSQTAECLRNISPANLVGLRLNTFDFVYPFIDGTVLTQQPRAAFASGQFNRVPVISGTNHDEWRLFVAVEYDLSGAPLTNSEYATAVDALFGPIIGPMVLGFYPLPASPPATQLRWRLALRVRMVSLAVQPDWPINPYPGM